MKHKVMKHSLKNYAPAGINLKAEETFFLCVYFASIIFAITCFWGRYNTEAGNIYTTYDGKRILSGVLMTDYIDVLGISLYGFAVLIVCMVALICWHYVYHYIDSRSIYTMKMLPKRGELHKRCLVLPASAILIGLATALILLVVFYKLYMILTPEQCIMPYQWDKIWDKFGRFY